MSDAQILALTCIGLVAAVTVVVVLIATRRESAEPAQAEEKASEESVWPQCPACGRPLPRDVRFCPDCGTAGLKEAVSLSCRACGSSLAGGETFCPWCGSMVARPSYARREQLAEIGDPVIARALVGVGVLSVVGGLLLCIETWFNPVAGHALGWEPGVLALTWLFTGIISGLVFFAGAAGLRYLHATREYTKQIAFRLSGRISCQEHQATCSAGGASVGPKDDAASDCSMEASTHDLR